MLKLLGIISSIFFLVPVSAKEIDLIIPVKTSGTQYILSQELKPLLEEKGYIVNLKISGTCIKAGVDYKESKTSVAMLIFNAYSALPECENSIPDDKSWVINLTKSKLLICGRPGKDNLGIIRRKEKATIGSVNVYPPNIVLSLLPSLKYVPYKSSGSLAQGFISGDTDLLITNSFRASKLTENKQAECFITTGNENHLGAEAATKIFKEWKYNDMFQLFSMVHKNMTVDESRKFKKDMKDIVTGDKWRAFAVKNGYDIDIDVTSDFYNKSSKLWSRD